MSHPNSRSRSRSPAVESAASGTQPDAASAASTPPPSAAFQSPSSLSHSLPRFFSKVYDSQVFQLSLIANQQKELNSLRRQVNELKSKVEKMENKQQQSQQNDKKEMNRRDRDQSDSPSPLSFDSGLSVGMDGQLAEIERSIKETIDEETKLEQQWNKQQEQQHQQQQSQQHSMPIESPRPVSDSGGVKVASVPFAVPTEFSDWFTGLLLELRSACQAALHASELTRVISSSDISSTSVQSHSVQFDRLLAHSQLLEPFPLPPPVKSFIAALVPQPSARPLMMQIQESVLALESLQQRLKDCQQVIQTAAANSQPINANLLSAVGTSRVNLDSALQQAKHVLQKNLKA